MPYVYIVQCRDNTLYTGYTVDIDRRLEAHQEGLASKYTRGRTPVNLVYCEDLPTKSDALRREMQIKKMSRTEKMLLIDKFAAKSFSE